MPVLAFLSVLSLMVVVLMHAAVRRVLARPVAPGLCQPPVSILKPLRGVDDGLAENLESFAHLQYPVYEILLGAEDPADPALPIARAFQARHPELPISVHVCDAPFGRNPKVNVLVALARHARHGVLLVSDSNIRVDPRFLADTAAELVDPKVALVTNPLVGAGEETLGSAMENAHLDSFIVSGTCAALLYAGRACVTGKTMLFRKDVFEQEIGWRSLRGVLAEDYFMGRRLEKAGYKVVIAPHPVITWNARWTADRFVARHVRWSQIRRRLGAGAFVLEPLFNPLPLAGLLFLASLPSGSWGGAGLAAVVVAAKLLLDASLARRLRGPTLPPLPIRAMICRDALLPVIWIQGALRSTVDWRGHPIRLGRHTRLNAVPTTGPRYVAEARRRVA